MINKRIALLFAGPVAERVERRPKLRPDLDHVLLEPPLLGCGLASDSSGLGMCFLDDQVRLAPGLLFHVLSRPFGGHERRAQKRLELAMLRRLGLDLLEAVGEVGALAPDALDAIRDLREELVVAGPAVAAGLGRLGRGRRGRRRGGGAG